MGCSLGRQRFSATMGPSKTTWVLPRWDTISWMLICLRGGGKCEQAIKQKCSDQKLGTKPTKKGIIFRLRKYCYVYCRGARFVLNMSGDGMDNLIDIAAVVLPFLALSCLRAPHSLRVESTRSLYTKITRRRRQAYMKSADSKQALAICQL